MNINLIDKLKENKIFPIIRNNTPEKTYDIASAIIDGGIDVIEVTLDSPDMLKIIKKLSTQAIVCVGGIITSLQAQAAVECGAKFISSPIFQKNLVKLSKNMQIPLIVGTTTPNEAYKAWKCRIPIVKIYPVTALGGADYIQNMLRPMPFLNVIPQGDVKLEEINAYINAGAISVGVGRHLTVADSYSQITQRTKSLLENLKQNG